VLSSAYCNVYTAESTLVQTAQGYDVSIVVSFPEPLPNPLLPAWTRGITKAGAVGAWTPVGAHSLSPKGPAPTTLFEDPNQQFVHTTVDYGLGTWLVLGSTCTSNPTPLNVPFTNNPLYPQIVSTINGN
jgi:hypothetical protein